MMIVQKEPLDFKEMDLHIARSIERSSNDPRHKARVEAERKRMMAQAEVYNRIAEATKMRHESWFFYTDAGMFFFGGIEE